MRSMVRLPLSSGDPRGRQGDRTSHVEAVPTDQPMTRAFTGAGADHQIHVFSRQPAGELEGVGCVDHHIGRAGEGHVGGGGRGLSGWTSKPKEAGLSSR